MTRKKKPNVLQLVHPTNSEHVIHTLPEHADAYRSQGWIDDPKPEPVTGTK